MNALRYRPVCLTPLLLMVALLLVSNAGCGNDNANAILDANAFLDRYEKERRRHDPLYFSEIDLGEYTVTQRHDPAIYFIRFHLYGVVPDNLMDQFTALLEVHNERVKSEVREAVQRSDIDHLNDPTLRWLKSELILAVNRSLRAPMLRDVVFAEFSFEKS